MAITHGSQQGKKQQSQQKDKKSTMNPAINPGRGTEKDSRKGNPWAK